MTKIPPNPLWITPIYQDDTGQDFLGLRAVSARITDFLLPGIITITDRARYYSFFSWLLTDYMHEHPKGWSLGKFIKRREQIYALANIAYSADADGTTTINQLNGSDKLTDHWDKYSNQNSIPISVDNYLKASMGGYNDYAGAMRKLHITRNSDEEDQLAILPNGQKLARAFERAIQNTRYYEQRRKYDNAEAIPVSVLREYGEAGHLNRVVGNPDHKPLLDTLFAFGVPHHPTWDDPEQDNLENMRGSLGLILEMLNQARTPFSDNKYRQAITYAGCSDYRAYRPSKQLRPFLAHWQMYQLREYYVYALYGLWVYFLKWLSQYSPAPFSVIDSDLAKFDLKPAMAAIDLKLKPKSPGNWALQDWFDQLLSATEIEGGTFESRCQSFSKRAKTLLNEHELYLLIENNHGEDSAILLGLAWLLLSTLYLRLKGLKSRSAWNAWHWAEDGDIRRRSMAQLVCDLDALITSGQTIAVAWQKIFRDYIVSQHILTCLDKWQNRQANTFHFNYEQGVLEWVRFDDRALEMTASRFFQASVALFDLGLYEENDKGVPQLTTLGKQTLARVLENTDG